MFVLLFCSQSCSVDTDWELSYNSQGKGINVQKKSKPVFDNLYVSYRWGEREVTSQEYSSVDMKTKTINDAFGKGKEIRFTYKQDGLPGLTQLFYVYPDRDYLLTEFFLESAEGDISANYMAPVCLNQSLPIPDDSQNRALFVPFDNDCWVRYQSKPLNFDRMVSYEVTAVFNNTARNGIVVGSVEHDNWKTAIEMSSTASNNIHSLICYGGVADSLTRDSKPHGALSGKKIKSPKVLLGVFTDWRDGMDEFGKANAVVTPPKKWDKAMPFGWNSWGVLQFGLTYPKALEVSDFFKTYLQETGFVNADNAVYIGLDSGWNRFSEEELKSFVDRCRQNGQIPGIYWTPFTDWGKNPEATVHDAREYKYGDIYVYANGKPQDLDGAYAIDPTHPAIEARMKKTSELFRRCGFEYVKMDFMTHGAMEGDKWHRPEIQTGIQAYNYGMTLLNQYFGDMYINLSISPVFPSQYAQSRRIACDAWNKIKDTEYTMNALSYGWWIDNAYPYNDADHIVLQQATEGENRARITSAVITGLYIAGDDFSAEGSDEGKERAKTYLTNRDINAIANGVSFRPVEGNGERSEHQFVREEDDCLYYVIFNYGEDPIEVSVPMERIGLDAGRNYEAKELWSGLPLSIKEKIVVPGKDAKTIRVVKSEK